MKKSGAAELFCNGAVAASLDLKISQYRRMSRDDWKGMVAGQALLACRQANVGLQRS
jgi:hypothetical protein